METLATLLRYMQFYGHIAHNMTYGTTFFQDHEFLKDVYTAYDNDYDHIVERCIGLGTPLDLFKVQTSAVQLLSKSKFTTPEAAFATLLEAEVTLCSSIQKELAGKTEGTRQLLGEMANQSEMRQYHMKQRTNKGEVKAAPVPVTKK